MACGVAVAGRRPNLSSDHVLGPLDAEVDDRLGLVGGRLERVGPLDLAQHPVDLLVALAGPAMAPR